jgi:tungstate transport system substrate-binding protein
MRNRASSSSSFILVALVIFATLTRVEAEPAAPPATRPVVRVAAVAGVADLGFWDELSTRFEKAAGIKVQTVTTGSKDTLPQLFKQGGIDLITMPASDPLMTLAAEDYAMDVQPWASIELVLLGPATDPAGIKGMTDATAAIRKIVESKANFFVHGSAGADLVVRAALGGQRIQLEPEHEISTLDDHQRQVLQRAADKEAYTLISRIPFKSGRIAPGKIAVMVEGDPILRRPIVLALANPRKLAGARTFEARRLAAFLRSDDTQRWIGEFGRGKLDARPLFSPIGGEAPAVAGTGAPLLAVSGEVSQPLALDAAAWAKLPRHEVRVKGKDGEQVYAGVFLRDILKRAGAPLGDHQMRGPNLALYLMVEAADGYKAVFSLAELDDDFAERSVLLADRRDGEALDGSEGPLRLVAPQEARQARWVRRVVRLRVERD